MIYEIAISTFKLASEDLDYHIAFFSAFLDSRYYMQNRITAFLDEKNVLRLTLVTDKVYKELEKVISEYIQTYLPGKTFSLEIV